MKIELYYFEGCPNYQATIENLNSALKERDIENKIDIICIESIEHAQETHFQGSPSIIIDGKDLEGKNEPPIFGCMLYEINGKMTRTPSKQYIGDKIDEITKRNST